MATSKCGHCHGCGERKQYDGVGGAWYERCGQCNGRGTVETADDGVVPGLPALSKGDLKALETMLRVAERQVRPKDGDSFVIRYCKEETVVAVKALSKILEAYRSNQ